MSVREPGPREALTAEGVRGFGMPNAAVPAGRLEGPLTFPEKEPFTDNFRGTANNAKLFKRSHSTTLFGSRPCEAGN